MLKFRWKDKCRRFFYIALTIIRCNSGGVQMSNFKSRENKVERKMAILTAKCNRAFVVSPKQSKKFLEHKCNNNTNKEMLSKITLKIKDNNGKA